MGNVINIYIEGCHNCPLRLKQFDRCPLVNDKVIMNCYEKNFHENCPILKGKKIIIKKR